MNAKDTLKKIADALNITSKEEAKVETAVEAPVETVEAPVEDVKPVEETPVVETPVEDVKEVENEDTTEETPETDPKEDEPKEDVKEDAPEVESEAIETAKKMADKAEEMKDEIKKDEVQEPSELDLLKQQLNELKDIIKQQSEVPAIDEEPKGLVHNPEGNVSKKTTKIGNKGGDVISRVYKYINR